MKPLFACPLHEMGKNLLVRAVFGCTLTYAYKIAQKCLKMSFGSCYMSDMLKMVQRQIIG